IAQDDSVCRVMDWRTGTDVLWKLPEDYWLSAPVLDAKRHLVLSTNLDDYLHLWNAKSQEAVHTFRTPAGKVLSFAVSANKRAFAYYTSAETLVVCDLLS